MKDSAIEILIYKPNPDHLVPQEQKGVVVNPRLKQRFKHFLPIGVYIENSDLRYYFFDQCDEAPQIYHSLNELKRDLPESLANIFENKPKLFIMGHGNGGYYGLGNCHGPSEHIYDKNFDKLLFSFKQTLPEHHGEIFVTLEACNTDSQLDAIENQQEKPFLERVSVEHPEITFSGTGPWDSQDAQTGFRSLTPQAPITSMAGNIWKAGNSVIFYHDQYQVAVRKSLFASTKTAKELKINTIEYARAILGENGSDELITKISLSRDILKIQDLNKIDGFLELQIEEEKISQFIEQEKQVLEKEQENYLTSVHGILDRADSIEQLTDRDILELLLGLKEPTVFKDHESLIESILDNKDLLQLLMVSCGKVLVGGPSNNSIIDLLLNNDANINSVDDKGNTALHYAVMNFYNYRKEPLNLIKKLLDSGASLEAQNNQEQTPIDTAKTHCKDARVTGSDELLALLLHRNCVLTPLDLQQSVRKIFQMSAHKASEQLSLPNGIRQYVTCSEGTLHIPQDAVKKLHNLLKSLKGNNELLSAFELELNSVIADLAVGNNTGEILHHETDEIQPKFFSDIEENLMPVIDKLNVMKQEMNDLKNSEKQTTALLTFSK